MTIILIVIIFIFVISAIWIWNNLGSMEKNKKIGFIAIGFVVMYIITLLIFLTTKGAINYPNAEIENVIRNTLVMIFTGLNSLIILPYLAKLLGKTIESEIEKEEITKKVIIILIVFLVAIFMEASYLKSTQQGILNIYSEVQDAER